MKRYELYSRNISGLNKIMAIRKTGAWIKYSDHEAVVKHLKENDLIQEEEIIKLVENEKEMLSVLKNISSNLYDREVIHGLGSDIATLIEKVEGEQNDNS